MKFSCPKVLCALGLVGLALASPVPSRDHGPVCTSGSPGSRTPPCKAVHAPLRRHPRSRSRAGAGADSHLARRSTHGVSPVVNGVTVYYLEVDVGTPPQPQLLALDTGSSDLWVNIASSHFCANPANGCADSGVYDASVSSTSRLRNWDFNTSYVFGDASGAFVSDTLAVAGFTVPDAWIGVANYTTIAPGFAGLGFPGLESTAFRASPPYTYPNLLDSLVSTGAIDSPAFSLYLNDVNADEGSLLFGAIDTAKFQPPLHTMPIWNSGTLYHTGQPIEYTLQVTAIDLVRSSSSSSGSSSSSSSSSSASPSTYSFDGTVAALVDSGYSTLTLPTDLYHHMVFDYFGGQVTPGLEDFGYTVNCSFVDDHPDDTLSFTFADGYKFTVAASQVLAPYTPEICVILVEEATQPNRIVLGDPILRASYVVFDQHNYQISWAHANLNANQSSIHPIPSKLSRGCL